MKKIVAIAGLCTLAACGGGGDEAAPEEGEMAVAEEVAAVPDAAGTYTGTNEDGEDVTWMLNEDGSYEMMEAGETVETGTWEDNIRGTCMSPESGDGESCYNIQTGEGDQVDVTGPDGATMQMTMGS